VLCNDFLSFNFLELFVANSMIFWKKISNLKKKEESSPHWDSGFNFIAFFYAIFLRTCLDLCCQLLFLGMQGRCLLLTQHKKFEKMNTSVGKVIDVSK
jgi:hypothetical protein